MDQRNLLEIEQELWEARKEWKEIGLALKILKSDLDVIDKEKKDNIKGQFEEMIFKWLTSNDQPPTWTILCEALESPTVGHKRLAASIRQKKLPKANQTGQ